MRPRDILLAVGIAAVWGLNFLSIKLGLDRMPALLFCSLRLFAVGLPLLVLRRGPGVPWRWVFASALALGVLHFSLFFWGIAEGMPAGLTSLVLQSQAIFTVLLAAPLLRERPGFRQIAGLLLATGGMAVVAAGVGGERPPFAFALVIASSAFWGLNNIIMRKAAPPDMARFLMWVGAVGALPLLGISFAVDGYAADLAALRGIDATAVGAIAYTSALSTILGFGLWGVLIRRYGAGTVAPFSMLVPFFGMSSAALFLGERLELTDILGGLLVVGGILLGAIRRVTRSSQRPDSDRAGAPEPVLSRT
ncbi:MAG: EamA family transporter [Hamadaea sp.]|uniref:EamA family transporter n=1 Tax=Hamadaea sp. TaxID=2024425 RepID=UPI0017E7ECD3|nr:EamA family transporter [Hamadaea sp.]NUR70060.1 EamA family transporter [Hamadaea sp.]NUT21604.1 EamA family transporter [Hamadaea sp.]